MDIKGWLAAIEAEREQVRRLRKAERSIEQMKVGEIGYTLAWVDGLDYPVWHGPCVTMNTAIERTKNGWTILFIDPTPAQERERRKEMLRP